MSHIGRLSALIPVVFLAIGASPALAQAPGVCECAVPAQSTIVTPPPAPQGWDGRRWSVSLVATSLGVHPESGDEDDQIEFGGGGIEGSFRLNARWEFSLRFEGGEQDAEDGGLAYSATTIAASYHLTPYRRWDWYLLAGFGGTAIGPKGADEDSLSQHGHAHLGVGLERRFRRWGISAELRAVGLSPAEEEGDMAVPPPRDPGGMGDAPTPTGMIPPEVEADEAEEGLSGGAFSIAATYYF